jgi:hypothetical protein
MLASGSWDAGKPEAGKLEAERMGSFPLSFELMLPWACGLMLVFQLPGGYHPCGRHGLNRNSERIPRRLRRD